MAAVVAYMLPEGMVDIVYSFDGQGVSDAFLDYISDSRKENALNRTPKSPVVKNLTRLR